MSRSRRCRLSQQNHRSRVVSMGVLQHNPPDSDRKSRHGSFCRRSNRAPLPDAFRIRRPGHHAFRGASPLGSWGCATVEVGRVKATGPPPTRYRILPLLRGCMAARNKTRLCYLACEPFNASMRCARLAHIANFVLRTFRSAIRHFITIPSLLVS
jgi:hypothetical protein